MGIFGLGSSVKKKPAPKAKAVKSAAKTTKGKAAKGGANAEAQAMLAKMQAKSDAGDCPFC